MPRLPLLLLPLLIACASAEGVGEPRPSLAEPLVAVTPAAPAVAPAAPAVVPAAPVLVPAAPAVEPAAPVAAPPPAPVAAAVSAGKWVRPTEASVPNIAPGAATAGLPPVTRPGLNPAILDLVQHYPLGAANPYDWKRGMNTDGVSRDLLWRGVPLALAAGDAGVHCSGITWEVYIQALRDAAGEGAGPSAEELLAVKETWYIRTPDETGPVGALAGHGLGALVPDVASLRPGDIVQFWRNSGKGHSAVFIEHRRNRDGSIRGLVYWSAQGSSGGIGRRIVSFGEDVNQVTRLYAVRATAPAAAPAG